MYSCAVVAVVAVIVAVIVAVVVAVSSRPSVRSFELIGLWDKNHQQ